MNLGVNKGSDPEKIAKLVSTILLKKRPKIRYKVGSFIERNGVILKRILHLVTLEIIFLISISIKMNF